MRNLPRLFFFFCFLTLATFAQFSVLSALTPTTVEAAKKKKKKRKKAKRSVDDYTHSEVLEYCKKKYVHAAFIRVQKRNNKWICYTYE